MKMEKAKNLHLLHENKDIKNIFIPKKFHFNRLLRIVNLTASSRGDLRLNNIKGRDLS